MDPVTSIRHARGTADAIALTDRQWGPCPRPLPATHHARTATEDPAPLPICEGQRQVTIATGARDAIDATQIQPSTAQQRRALDKVLVQSTSFALAQPLSACSRVGVNEVTA